MARSSIFITGVAGFLGSHLGSHLLAEGHRVVGCDNLVGGYEDNIPEGVAFHRADCNDFDKMREPPRRARRLLL
jgi:UDP-glucose 4-epimerase